MRGVWLLVFVLGCRKSVLELDDVDGDGFTAAEDCNDDDELVFPGAEEICDGIDNNCSGGIDDAAVDAPIFYPDDDGDGFGIVRGQEQACDAPDGFVSEAGDCNDNNITVYPGAPEICDNLDNDCNGIAEDDGTASWYPDADDDGVGAIGIALDACEPPDGYVSITGDCDDRDPLVAPEATEVCDTLDNNCDGQIDEGLTTTFYADGDDDGFGGTVTTQACDAPEGFVAEGGDCNDASALALPGGTEVCDTLDNNCDGQVDEGLTNTYYADGDADGFGSDVATVACELPDGFADISGDCNDASNLAFPGGTEVCDTLDNNCDGQVDEGLTSTYYADADADGFGSDVATVACELPDGFADISGDCNDDAAAAFPGASEVCDGLDNDCNGFTDDGVRTIYYADADADGFGTDAVTVNTCAPPDGFTDIAGDCNDAQDAVFPGATESCDGLDNDCNQRIDDGLDIDWFVDADQDGFGDDNTVVQACEPPSGVYTNTGGDCDDLNPEYNPDADEACDDTDRNCDGSVGSDNDGDGLSDAVCGGSDCNDDDPSLPVDGSCADGNTCLEIRNSDPNAPSGTYLLDIDEDGPLEPIEVTCDLDNDGGGWTPVFLVDDLGGSGNISGETQGFNRGEFIDLLGTNRFTDATWSYDAESNSISEGTQGMVVGADQGALDIGLFEGRWTDVRMTCNTADRATTWTHHVTVPDYTTQNGNFGLLGAASNGTSYTVDPSTNSMNLSTVWHDNELQGTNSNHYLCDLFGASSNGTTQFGFCYTNFLSNPNSSDFGDSVVSISFGSTGRTDGWTHGFTAECGPMGRDAQQNNGTYAIWIR